MKFPFLSRWMTEDTGAVTVDWTVLAAAVVGLGIASAAAIRSGSDTLGAEINASLVSASVVMLGGQAAATGRALLVVTDEIWDAWMEELAGYDEPQLQAIYSNWTGMATEQLGEGDTQAAAMTLDAVAAIATEIQSRGITIPRGAPTSAELDARYATQV